MPCQRFRECRWPSARETTNAEADAGAIDSCALRAALYLLPAQLS